MRGHAIEDIQLLGFFDRLNCSDSCLRAGIMDELEKQIEECEILIDNIRACLNLGDMEQAARLLRQLNADSAIANEMLSKQIIRITKKLS
jgi:hypothetical protein